MITDPRFCKLCREPLSPYKRKDSKYCSDMCRKKAYELRNPNRKWISETHKGREDDKNGNQTMQKDSLSKFQAG